MAIGSTRDRVPQHTAADVNERIRADMEGRVQALEGHPRKIAQRLRELDEEWDIERAIEANASALAFTGVALGAYHHRNWLILPGLVTAFLFQHAVQGWCPPVPVLRRLGFRTSHEIETERHALKALQGEYDGASGSASDAIDAASV